ncbi:MAG: hypothetical protein K2W96_16380, partial [Gemmataceae bacterium]|nr:hypothetical protein [Gemmataceae bacterium]
MYHETVAFRPVARQRDLGPAPDPLAPARLALSRVRKLLSAFVPGMRWDIARLRSALSSPLPRLDHERRFALGWLAWLAGDFADAVPFFQDAGTDEGALGDLPALEPKALLARSAYWLARCRLRLGEEAIAGYENVLKRLGGDPQGTAWFVDLLWRAGRVDRAEQVWRSVRTNKRVLACDEGPLLDARLHLRRGEMGPAEKQLREAAPRSGPAWVEWRLLLAWAQANPRRAAAAQEEMDEAARGPYPAAALEEWRRMLAARLAGGLVPFDAPTGGWRDFLEGRHQEALPTAAAPFARYALAVAGEGAAEALASHPPLHLAQRLKWRAGVERFLRREIGPGDVLELLAQADRAGYRTPLLDHARALAGLLLGRG